jgi:hypothetical protein
MTDPWTDRLSEYLDGELSAREARQLEEHLATCDDCRSVAAGLRAVIEAAALLPADVEPARDLWPGIAAATTAREEAPAAVLEFNRFVRAPAMRRRFTFSVPQLAAAAVLLVAVSAGTALWLGGGAGGATATGVIVQSAGGPVNGEVRLVSSGGTDADVDAEIARLEETLALRRDALDPATVEVLERSLESIDSAMEAARAALADDPGNPLLARQLDNTTQMKLDMLRRVHRVQRAGT